MAQPAEQPDQEVKSALDFYVLLQPKGCGSGPEPSSRAEVRAALADLVSAYEDPQVQAEVIAASSQCQEAHRRGHTGPGSEGDWPHCLRLLLTPLQMSVARDHGFAESAGGLQRMQNAIIRGICEGDTELREKANRALELLLVPRVGRLTTEVSAEELLFCTQDKVNLETSWVPVQQLLVLLQDGKGFDVEGHRRRLRKLEEARRPRPDFSLSTLATWLTWERHGFPLCLSRRPAWPGAGEVARLHRPSPEEVFEHVARNRPLVITGALDERSFPPLEGFKDFEYLRSRCGHRHVKVKGDPSLDAGGRKVFVNNPFVSLRLEEYLDMVEEAERSGDAPPFYMGKVFLADELPEMVEDIEASLASPWRLYGSAFGHNKNGVHTYFGCGRNTTSIHADPSENLLVVVSGRKTFQLLPPWEADCLYCSAKLPLNSCVPPFLRPDAMPPDVGERFPEYRHARPMIVELEAGDMLYLPIFWWHGVTGGEGRNMILNWWSDMHPSKAARASGPEVGTPVRDFMEALGIPAALPK
mmetsp:Transcript_49977/g.154454  ORF Transcript_49977/g.154454 Transcript_49977/m.154454 type:complete len:528 (+) Transcript_49977:57-1640(+)